MDKMVNTREEAEMERHLLADENTQYSVPKDLCMISYITNQPIYKKGLTENMDCNCNCELCGKSDTLARTLCGGGRGGGGLRKNYNRKPVFSRYII